MARDPYDVLGIARTTSQDEVRKAYRKLAKASHPDLHPGDRQAEERFKEINAAYDLLGDPAKRIRFDRGEIDASGAEKPKQQSFYREYADAEAAGGRRYHSTAGFEDLGDASDFFGSIFGAGRRGAGGTPRMKGPDLRYTLTVDFLDAARGARKRVTMADGRTIDLAVPEGTADGQTLRLKGQGLPGLGGGPAGDALVEITVAPHPLFGRRDADILIELPISLDEAILGAKVEVPTIDGKVTMTIPPGSTTGQVLRLRGKGVRKGAGAARGDQLVTLKVAMPPAVDPELARFVREWRGKHPYDPRRDWGGTR